MTDDRSAQKNPINALYEMDGFEDRKPKGVHPNRWAFKDVPVEDKMYLVAVEEAPVDNGDHRYTMLIKQKDSTETPKVFRVFSSGTDVDAYQWLRDLMVAVLASHHSSLDGACAYIQDYLGVSDGGFAGHHFSDDDLAQDFKNHETMKSYLLAEARFNEPDDVVGAMLMTGYEARRYGIGQKKGNDLNQSNTAPKP